MKKEISVCLMVGLVLFYAGIVWSATETDLYNYFGTGAGDNNLGEYNSFFGADAGNANTEGDYNSFFGRSSGMSNTTASGNSFFGAGTGVSSTGENNSFFGHAAGYANTEGTGNSFFGKSAGLSNTTGAINSFFGAGSGFSNTTGSQNSFFGHHAGNANTTGYENSFFGKSAGYSNTTGSANSFFGSNAGYNNTEGDANSFFGPYAGAANTTGYENSFFGAGAGYLNTTGFWNTFIGMNAGHDNTEGNGNVFIGFGSGFSETGSNKLYISNSETDLPLIYGEFDNQYLEVNGDFNVKGTMSNNSYYQTQSNFPGFWLDELDDGQKGAFFVLDKGVVQMQRRGTGYGAYEGAPLRIAIMAPADTFNITSSGYVGIGTRNPSFPLQMVSGAHVTTGGVWTNSSSRDYKENISSLSIENAQAALNGLEPVTYNYKAESSEQYVGFIAEDVPELVAMGDRKSLSPMDIVAVLTKVVQEQQRSMQEQQNIIQELQKAVEEQQAMIGELRTALQFKQNKDANVAQAN